MFDHDRARLRLLLAVLALTVAGSAHAQDEEDDELEPQHVALYLGGRYQKLDDLVSDGPLLEREKIFDLSIGVHYEYLGRDNVGVVLFGQYTGGDADATLVGAGMNAHGGRHFWFQFAAVYEWRESSGGGSIRTGLGYEIQYGKRNRGTVTPSAFIDFDDKNVVVWAGLSIGRRF